MLEKTEWKFHLVLWIILSAILIWSGWRPFDFFTWVLEVAPILIVAAVLFSIYRHFYFSRFICILMLVHAAILAIGGHYTYAEMPLFNWLRDTFHLARNHYDRVGHFMQGFSPALISREVLIRRGVVKRGAWLSFIVICICGTITSVYELCEWQASVWTGTKADAFLGSQGDVWDTQKDMAMCFIGGLAAILFMTRWHDRSINKLNRKLSGSDEIPKFSAQS
jgi:putative membrane protein